MVNAEQLASPSFSQPGGFYAEASNLDLGVTNRGAEIHLTLDGTEPTLASPRYRRPLRIGSRAGTRNTISAIPTTPGGAPPLGEVFKGWAVRARSFNSNGLPSAVATATF
jgi:Chitobiase/beta-hexosaminidase C-terminal domain